MCLCVHFSADAQWTYVDSLLAAQDTMGAMVNLERVAYRAQQADLQNEALLRKAYLYKAQRRYAMASQTLSRANPFVGQDSLRFLVLYESSLMAYFNEDFAACRTEAQKVRFLLVGSGYEWDAFHLELMAMHGERKWAEAQELMDQYASAVGWQVDVKEMYGELPTMKSLDTAGWLQLFLPGAGQWYAGHFWEGAISATVNAAAIAFTLYHFWQGYYITGALTGAALFYAFFTGGLRYTDTLVINKNQRVSQEYNKRLNGRLLALVQEST